MDDYPKTPGLSRAGITVGAAAFAADALVGVVAFVGLGGGWGSSAAIWIVAAACVIGFAAIAVGVTALRRLPHSTELGGGLAITGIVLGVLSIVAAPLFGGDGAAVGRRHRHVLDRFGVAGVGFVRSWAMNRIVIRPRIQIPVLVVLSAVWGLLGLTYVGSIAEREWFGTILGAVLVGGGILGIWRSLRLGVVIDSDGVRVRHFDRRDRFTPWRNVHAIECAQIDSRAGMPVYGPVIHLEEGGEAMPILALGTYSQEDAQAKVDQLRAFKTERTA